MFVAPLLWMAGSSLKPEGEVWTYPPTFLPKGWNFQWGNYPYAMENFPFVRSLANTLLVVVGVMVGRLLSASLVAYGFARVRFPFRNALFVVLLSTMMIPYHITLIPQYLIFRDLGWIDSFKPLVVPSFFGDAFYIFLLRQFFMSIPRDYDDAARIDGCGTFAIFWRILLPLLTPALGTVAIFTFMGTWSDFMAPLVYLNSSEKQTMAIAYMLWQRGPQHLGYRHNWNHVMALGVAITIPPMLVFFFAQRYFIQGVVATGIKG